MDILPQLSLIVILVLVNAFFSCSEIAIVSVNKTKLIPLIEENNQKAIKLQKMIDSPSKLLSTIQVAITLAGFFASASAAVSLSEHLSKVLDKLNIAYSSQISLVVITLLLSYITLVFGELVPKRIGLQNPLKISLKVVGILNLISIIFTPLIAVLTYSTNFVIFILRLNNKNESEDLSREEMKAVLNTGDLQETEKEILENVIEFDEKSAREVMIPRPNVMAVQSDKTLSEILKIEDITRYSRVPVYEEDLDDIVGVLHLKDLLLIDDKNILVKEVLKKAFFVPETKKISSLFSEMKKNNNHLAILIDEYGGMSGIVTMEDLLEEIVGDIHDEYDKENLDITEISKQKYLVNGEVSIHDFNDYFDTDLSSEYYDSIAGLLIEKIGFIPKENDKIDDIVIDNMEFKIQKARNRRIEKIIVSIRREDV
ncbi:hemolysin family protein [Oceanivirga miroungae]|uniref:Magnesium and cobalt efflux protein CorC n=1 Tax=Oceanivirga miroungae TaxID=1130046 RepID=A0A6I8MDW3_9FUSO|nr:hemolysin family protein [Oceanivirga miroungae]VWL85727.1 Magnesium and cobalt efflux protein CorC [Oceanivirga miroungae]